MAGREIVTLQIGHYSNFVGSHWWNIQEGSFNYDINHVKDGVSLNHDVLFREGQTTKGAVTFTPRLVCIDLKGSLNTLSKDGGLYGDDNEEEVKWCEDVTLHEAGTGYKNEYLTDLEQEESVLISDKEENNVCSGQKYYNLDKDVTVWSDYLKTYLHPKTLHIINDYMLGDTERPFNVFGMGEEIFSKPETFEDVEDRIRFFVEDCDLLQGFHCLVDTYDGFGGVASTYLQYLQDEFSSKSKLTFGMTPHILPDSTAVERSNRIINSAICYEKLCESSGLFIPISLATSLWRKLGSSQTFPHLQYNVKLNYHTSAIIASTLDTMTIPYRRDDNFSHLTDITSSFSMLGRKVAAINTSLPFVLKEDNSSLIDSLMSYGNDPPWQSLVPHVTNSTVPDLQSCVLRGISSHTVKSNNVSSLSRGILASCSNTQDVLQQYLTDVFPNTKNAGCVFNEALPVKAPFPNIFSPSINSKGFLSTRQRLPLQGVESVPMMTSLQSSKEIYNLIHSLYTETTRFDIRKHHRFLQSGLDEDMYRDVLDNLQTLSTAYID
ncbi:hypothetical protein LOTGIDRAFT_120630 [Lottia gigantea]|uniref:Protein misato homolog 1 n=1 Tax=Lottia gigantea TaxID=225164 RepID=V3ZMF7_LOTGI|nr:hypothetical protein LOTGIDRAFT_120630 [Lottia gigantea]ESO92553.1 hypothetical protein LOTGIDRAFT_120630 [Lottia gigantea]